MLTNDSMSGHAPVRGVYGGSFVQAYQQYVDTRARRSSSGRAAGGATAVGFSGAQMRTLANDLFFPIDVSSLAARVATKRIKRKEIHHVPFTERALLKLCNIVNLTSLPFPVRLRAAGFVAHTLNAVRHKAATRFRIIAESLPPLLSLHPRQEESCVVRLVCRVSRGLRRAWHMLHS